VRVSHAYLHFSAERNVLAAAAGWTTRVSAHVRPSGEHPDAEITPSSDRG